MQDPRTAGSRDPGLKRRKASDDGVEIEIVSARTSKNFMIAPPPPKLNDPTPDLTTYGPGIRLGWIEGVLIPCLLNIWGVMLFLRIAWIVAQAGIALSVLIIFISGVVCVITTLSLSAICTNGEIKGGGVYFLVSRSLGAELGASVGIIFAFANAVAASMNTIGFCDSLNELLKSHSIKIIDNGPNDTRIIGAIALFVMCFICAVGMDWETRTQNLLIVIIITAITNFVIGASMGPTSKDAVAKGFAGLSLERAKMNWKPDFRYSEGQHHNFFSVFAIYFPAVTGVQAGANICGDLRDPATAIPKGTLTALAVSTTSYLTMAIMSGVGAMRDASGSTKDVGTDKIDSCKPNCGYGLHNNYEIMNMMALWAPLIYAGCWAATLSTALTNLLSVPRLIQALGLDRIYPGLIFFSKRYGKHGEPYRGYVLTFCVSACFLLIADLNTIAPLITNFYLASYALINFCTFHAAFHKPLNWRPRFRYYNTWLSLTGFFLCLSIMMIISWIMALVTTFIFFALYFIVLYRKPEASWGSSTEAQRYHDAIGAILNLTHRPQSIKLFNPQLLVLAGKPTDRPWLLDIARQITNVGSYMIVADIQPKKSTPAQRFQEIKEGERLLSEQKLRAFYLVIQEFTFEQALKAMIQSVGIGYIAPNCLLIGFQNKWEERVQTSLLSYYRMIQSSFEYGMPVVIFRVPRNLRPTKHPLLQSNSDSDTAAAELASMSPASAVPTVRAFGLMDTDSDIALESYKDGHYDKKMTPTSGMSERASHEVVSAKGSERSVVTKRKLDARITKTLMFTSHDILDAWWLYDDGGMNILLPYIIARRANNKMILRIFALSRGRHNMDEAESHLTELLKIYRIEYEKLTMVTGITDKPTEKTWRLFNSLIENHKSSNTDALLISEEETSRLHEKTRRHLRLRELLLENSFEADLVVITLPMPRQDVSAAMYMAWLEVLSKDMPPTLFVRGTSQAVIAI